MKRVNVQVGVHQGSVLSPFLFIIVLQAITEEFKHLLKEFLNTYQNVG